MSAPTIDRTTTVTPEQGEKRPMPLRWLLPLSTANLIANIGIVLTGGAVRLTDSGLGCPTWPSCTESSYVNEPALGIHGYVEFGNRTLTFALSAIMVAAFLAAWRMRRERPVLIWLAAIGFLGIVAQAIIGGITVLTGLNPWTVAGHFLVSMGLIYGAYALWLRVREADGPPELLVAPVVRWLVRTVAIVTAITLALGTIVTGSGPHSGDAEASRTGLDPETMSHLHADAVAVLIGLSAALIFTLIAVGAPKRLRKAAYWLLAAELAQGVIGIVQYLTDLPVALVAAHLLGACLVWLAAVHLLFSTRSRGTVSPG